VGIKRQKLTEFDPACELERITPIGTFYLEGRQSDGVPSSVAFQPHGLDVCEIDVYLTKKPGRWKWTIHRAWEDEYTFPEIIAGPFDSLASAIVAYRILYGHLTTS